MTASNRVFTVELRYASGVEDIHGEYSTNRVVVLAGSEEEARRKVTVYFYDSVLRTDPDGWVRILLVEEHLVLDRDLLVFRRSATV